MCMNVETLSPQARAVLYAIAEISPAPAGEIAAAALRAAVAEVRTDRELKRHYAATMSEMLVLDKLLAIADELKTL